MKKTTTIYLLLLMVLTGVSKNVSAQDKGWLGINFGASVPVGDIAGSDGNTSDGFAETGISMNLLDFGWALNDNIGITAVWGSSAHEFNAAKFATSAGGGISVTADPWSTGRLLVGAFARPTDKPFYGRIMIGFATSNSPAIAMSSGPNVVNIEAGSSAGFAYSIGIGYSIPLGKKLALSANIDFVSTSVKHDVKTTSYINGFYSNSLTQFDNGYSTINFNIGLNYRFGN